MTQVKPHNEIVSGRTEGSLGAVFMVEPGRFEWEAILLASSLQAFAYDDITIWAYCRDFLVDKLHPRTLAFFEDQGITLRTISPGFEVPYPHGNKLYACADQRPHDATVLLDTDMFFIRAASLSDSIRPGRVSGRPTGGWMWGDTVEEWRSAYASVGLDLPRQRMARPDGSYVAPSVSAGYVAYEKPGFGQIWTDVALEIERKRLAKAIYPTLDQISLPVATAKAGMSIHMLDVKWNKAGKLAKGQDRQILAYHYQSQEKLKAVPFAWLADELIADFSDFGNLEELVEFYETEGNKPAEVLGNDGYFRAVQKKQRKVDVPFRR